MQTLHTKELDREADKAREDSRGLSDGLVDLRDDDHLAQPEPQYRTMRSRAGSRIARRFDDGTSASGLRTSNPEDAVSEHLNAAGSFPAIPLYSRLSDAGASEAPASSRNRSDSRISSSRAGSIISSAGPSCTLATDDSLDAAGLRQAIIATKSELTTFEAEFGDLEIVTASKLGIPPVPVRRGSASSALTPLPEDARRRGSVSSSSGYSGSMAGLANNRLRIASPPPSIARRPSRASSITSAKSAGIGQQDSYFRPVSTLFEEQEDLSLTVSIHHNGESHRELQEVRDRRNQLRQRYKARLDYLEARLQGQLIKDKLRR